LVFVRSQACQGNGCVPKSAAVNRPLSTSIESLTGLI
jgi:hypothetical protein